MGKLYPLSLVLALGFAVAIGGALAAPKVELTYMSWFTGVQGEIEEQVLNAWRAKNPDIAIKKISPPGVYATYQDKLFTMIAGGTPPDVVTLDTWWSQRFYKRKVCIEISSLVERDKVDPGMFRDGFWEEGISSYDGKLYGLPWGTGIVVMGINKNKFDKAGIPYPKMGWTINDFVQYAKKMTIDIDGDGKTDEWGTARQWFAPWIYFNGGDYVDRKTGKSAITKPEFTQMLQFIADLTLKERVQPTPSEQMGIARTGVETTGKMGMWISWDCYLSGTFQQMDMRKKFEWGMAYLPAGSVGPITFQKGNTMVIMKATKYPEESWQFMKWYSTSDEAQDILVKTLTYPVSKKAIQKEEFLSPPGLYKNLMEPSVKLAPIIKRLPYDVPGWTEAYNKILIPALDAIWSGDKTAQQAMNEIAAKFDQILDEEAKAVKR
ncbi:MAG: ABC transporter substrate-binding protein [bacterium]